MIIDNLKNSAQYKGLNPRIEKAFEFLENTDLKALEVGRYELDGTNLFVLIQEYDVKKPEDGKCEAHKNYIDIQYIISGSERMGYQNMEGSIVTTDYNPDKDVLFVKWDGDYSHYSEGMFAIYYPQDAHMPGISDGSCSKVKKAVVKIRI